MVEVDGIYQENVAGELLYSGYSEDYEKEGGSGLLMYNHYPALGYRKDNNNLVSSYEESYFTGEMYDVDNRLEKMVMRRRIRKLWRCISHLCLWILLRKTLINT